MFWFSWLYPEPITQDEVICNENMNYTKIQNKIREIKKFTGYLIKKFKENEHKNLNYIS